MKNLKKALALLLVVAMTASLVISASALSAKDYSDYTDVQNKDAVAMLTELQILNGYPTGDFQPTKVVTRAEMAKIIYVILSGGSDTAPTPDTQRYTDVYVGHWAEGYIAFCDDLGIIDGYGDGTFGPSDPVTGVQAAKMLLVAMGYDSAKETFTGTNWDYNVLKLASAAGLFDGFTATTSDGCTRDNAALLTYNALIADCVSYVGNTAVATGETLIGTYYGLVAVTGVVVANEYANLFGTSPLSAGKTEIAFIGDQEVDTDHAIDPLYLDWMEIDWLDVANALEDGDYDIDAVGDLLKMLGVKEADVDFTSLAKLPAYAFTFLNHETILDVADFAQLKSEVDDTDEYQSFVFTVGTSLDQVGKTVTVYAKLKGNYEQFTNLVEYQKYTMFSGAVVGNVVQDDDCVVKSVEGDGYTFDARALKKEGYTLDLNTRYFENYAAVWAVADGSVEMTYDYDADETITGLESIAYTGIYNQESRPYAFDAYTYSTKTNTYLDPYYDLYLYAPDITCNARGERLQFIDNDGDGVIEIILKTRQTFAVVQYDKYYDCFTFDSLSGPYNILDNSTAGNYDADLIDWTEVEPEDIVFDGELKDDMKVLVTPIDGTYYVTECETITGIPEEVNYNTDKEYYAIFDGTKYYESGLYWADDIWDSDAGDFDDSVYIAQYNWPVEELDPNSDDEYTCYLDDFGNIVAYTKNVAAVSRNYFLVTGAAYEILSGKQSDSLIFGAKAASDLTVGVGAYTADREGRNSTTIDDVETLYNGLTAGSIDKSAYVLVGPVGVGAYAYTSYENVFDIYNDYNVVDGTSFGDFSTLTKASFDDEDTLTGMSGVTDKYGVNLLETWTLDEEEIDSDSDLIDLDVSGGSYYAGEYSTLYVGSKTVFYIMLHFSDDTYNVISFTGLDDMPTMKNANDNDGYGIVNVYGQPTDASSSSIDAKAVVFELNIGPNGEGLPVRGIANWVYIYNIASSSSNYCQTVYGVDTDGKLVTLYNDAYYNKLDEDDDVGKWYAYYASPDSDCEKHDAHVVLWDEADWADEYENYAAFAYEQTLYCDQISALSYGHNDGRKVTIKYADGSTADKYVSFEDAALYMYCSNCAGYYNNDAIFKADYEALTDDDSPYDNTDDYVWQLIYEEEEDGDLVAIAIIIINDDKLSATEFNKISDSDMYGADSESEITEAAVGE